MRVLFFNLYAQIIIKLFLKKGTTEPGNKLKNKTRMSLPGFRKEQKKCVYEKRTQFKQ